MQLRASLSTLTLGIVWTVLLVLGTARWADLRARRMYLNNSPRSPYTSGEGKCAVRATHPFDGFVKGGGSTCPAAASKWPQGGCRVVDETDSFDGGKDLGELDIMADIVPLFEKGHRCATGLFI